MASAKKEAQKSLGSVEDYINLSGLNKERELANNMYNTNYSAYTNAYNDMLNKINSDREAARTDFGTGRSTIAENAYLKNRSDLSDLASRGLSGGVAQLSKLGNRMETGRQYSNLANTYYNRMNELDASQKSGENDYNYNVEMAQNSLNSMLADIDAREAAARNNYKAAVAQLAEQIQARRDANWNASQALKQAEKQYNNETVLALNENLWGKSWDDAVKYYNERINKDGSLSKLLGNPKNAEAYLTSIGMVKPTTKITSTPTVKSTNKMSTAGKVATGIVGALNPQIGLGLQNLYNTANKYLK
jgi:hypothetical protein